MYASLASVKKTFCCSGVGAGGVGAGGVGAGGSGAQVRPKNFWFVENSGKIPKRSGTEVSTFFNCVIECINYSDTKKHEPDPKKV